MTMAALDYGWSNYEPPTKTRVQALADALNIVATEA